MFFEVSEMCKDQNVSPSGQWTLNPIYFIECIYVFMKLHYEIHFKVGCSSSRARSPLGRKRLFDA